jgi:recombination associated protein RdgC
MFRSVRFYSVATPWPSSEQELSEQLLRAIFKPCGALTERSSGWEPPAPEAPSLLARRVGGADLLRLRSQVRVLPAAAVNEALESRLEEYRTRTQQEPSRRTKRQLKDQTRDELLAKALVRSERTTGLYIERERVIAVGSASETRAERFLEQLRTALGKLEVKPLAFETPFDDLLTRVFTGDAPREFVVGSECRMRDPSERKSAVRWQDIDLAHATVRKCLNDGMQLTHLGFEFGNALAAVLDANGALTKLRLVGLDEPQSDADDPLARLDAELALVGGTLRQLLASMKQALGASRAALARRD